MKGVCKQIKIYFIHFELLMGLHLILCIFVMLSHEVYKQEEISIPDTDYIYTQAALCS